MFITLTARGLRADITIVARAAIEDTEKKLKRAGADRVISPYKSSATEMARLALHPQLSGVVDVDSVARILGALQQPESGEQEDAVDAFHHRGQRRGVADVTLDDPHPRIL